MTRTLLALVLAAAAATPAVATPPAYNNGIVYTVRAGGGAFVADCTVVADRWTADYGPTRVTAVVHSPTAIWTRVHCWVTKNYTTYVDTETEAYGDTATIVDQGNDTIPVEGIQVCIEAESQLTVDAHPYFTECVDG